MTNPKYAQRRDDFEKRVKLTHPDNRYQPHHAHWRFPADRALHDQHVAELIARGFVPDEETAILGRNMGTGGVDRFAHMSDKARSVHAKKVDSKRRQARDRLTAEEKGERLATFWNIVVAQRGWTTRGLEQLCRRNKQPLGINRVDMLVEERKRLTKNARSRASKAKARLDVAA